MTQAKTFFYQKDKHIEPAFEDKSFPIVMAMDDGYAKVCAVSLVSLADNVADSSKYDIVILESRLSDENKEILTQLVAHKDNISLRFYNIEECIAPYRDSFFNQPNFTIEAYYRFFIVPLFVNYSRVLYLDADTIIEGDLRELFEQDLHGHPVGAVIDYTFFLKKEWVRNKEEVLKIPSNISYINSGLILFEIQPLVKNSFFEKSMQTLKELGKPVHQDQDVLNMVLHGDFFVLHKKWNYFIKADVKGPYKKSSFENAYKENLERIFQKEGVYPIIVHLIGAKKPWRGLQSPFTERFWFYAEQTPYHKDFVALLLDHLPNRLTYTRKKRRLYSLLALLPLGRTQDTWQWKWNAYNYEVLALERFFAKYGKK